MSNLFRFFCSISSPQVTAEADVLVLGSSLLCKVLVVSLIIDFFAQESAGGNMLGFFLAIL